MKLLARQRVLRANVFAAAAFQNEPHGNFRRAMLMKMKRGRARPAIRAVIFSGQRVHGILPQITFFRCQLHGFACGFSEVDLVEADRTIHIKQNAAGVLANRLRLGFRQRDVLVNDFEGVGGEGIFLFVLQRREDGLMHVAGNFGGRAADEFDQ